jgi:hypothetical protein
MPFVRVRGSWVVKNPAASLYFEALPPPGRRAGNRNASRFIPDFSELFTYPA